MSIETVAATSAVVNAEVLRANTYPLGECAVSRLVTTELQTPEGVDAAYYHEAMQA